MKRKKTTNLIRQKTTVVAISGGVMFLSLTALVFAGKLDGASYAASLGGLGSILGILVGVFSADHKKECNEPE